MTSARLSEIDEALRHARQIADLLPEIAERSLLHYDIERAIKGVQFFTRALMRIERQSDG